MTQSLFNRKKSKGEKISMLTCYDYWSARILNGTDVDALLVGDSSAMVMGGHASTLPATVDSIAYHTQAVAKGAPDKFIVADMPFLSFRQSVDVGMQAVQKLMQAGAHAVKLEGVRGHEALVQHIVGSGVPVMGHLGLTPQSVFSLGGYKVQGRQTQAADAIFEDAQTLERLGAFAVVLECVPAALAGKITNALQVPTIGIGAGPDTDGQVLVLQDMLGMNEDMKPKFLRQFLQGAQQIRQAVNDYHREVTTGTFPSVQESYE